MDEVLHLVYLWDTQGEKLRLRLLHETFLFQESVQVTYEGRLIQLEIAKKGVQGNVWDQPAWNIIYRLITYTYSIYHHLFFAHDIQEFGDKVYAEIAQYSQLYRNESPQGLADWLDNIQVRSHRANSVEDVESLFTFRRDYYEEDVYFLYIIFKGHPDPDRSDWIGLEFQIMPGDGFGSSSDEALSNFDVYGQLPTDPEE